MTPEIIHNHILYTQIVSPWNIVLMMCAWLTIRMVRQVFPELFSENNNGSFWMTLPKRLIPIYPVLICTFFYLFVAGPWIDPSLGLGERALLGVLCGSIAGHGHSVVASLLPDPIRVLLLKDENKKESRG